MSTPKEKRRQAEIGKLDIDRRHTEGRRSKERRLWLDTVYEDIYVKSYVNAIHPHFQVTAHAMSNMDEELSPAEWAANTMAIEDAAQEKSLRTLKVFAREMIAQGLVVDSKGVSLKASNQPTIEIEFLQLKTGT